MSQQSAAAQITLPNEVAAHDQQRERHRVPAWPDSHTAPTLVPARLPDQVVESQGDAPRQTITDNRGWAKAEPVISVMVPFFHHDPRALLHALDVEPVNAEIIVVDDGSADEALAAAVAHTVRGMRLPARFVHLDRNEGRSKGRNRLAGHARSDTFLFLDSDMLPDGPLFLKNYVRLAIHRKPAVAFGGFSTRQASRNPDFDLHKYMAESSDCAPAEIRRQFPEKHVFTSNLLVRRDVFEAEAFDEKFQGWGWEDVEWAMRVAKNYPLTHIDNPATHLGLDTPQAMAAKFEQSAANFARMLSLHPETVSRYRSFRAARLLKHVPLRGLWQPCCKAVALANKFPLRARAFAMRMYRASLYIDAV
jgi:hypothetical protein